MWTPQIKRATAPARSIRVKVVVICRPSVFQGARVPARKGINGAAARSSSQNEIYGRNAQQRGCRCVGMSTLHYGRRFIVVDIDIWRAANLLIKQHGENAEIVAAQRADPDA